MTKLDTQKGEAGVISDFAPVRFRADPRKVRVSIRQKGKKWLVFVQSRMTGAISSAFGQDPEVVLMRALERAKTQIDGIDLDMDWAYTHPWK